MKRKGTIVFILIVGILVILYMVFVRHLEVFMLSYDGKMAERKNPYYVEERKDNDILDILRSSEDLTTDIRQEAIEIMCHNEMIRNILLNHTNEEEENIQTYIEELLEMERIQKKDMEESYGEVIYIEERDYALAFSMDEQNILYHGEKICEEENAYLSYKEITMEGKEEILKKVRQDLEILGVTSKIHFEPESIYIKYYYSFYDTGENVYVMEDSVHKMKVEYEVPRGGLKQLQIGFQSEEA